ncbi:FecR family protein [Planctomicrobium sp. SH664]|uniref:FecR family protein n=1 Tax=Planctomicrobium sp. SH664 TaxID=3448125 RepID=UPI003F5AEB4E
MNSRQELIVRALEGSLSEVEHESLLGEVARDPAFVDELLSCVLIDDLLQQRLESSRGAVHPGRLNGFLSAARVDRQGAASALPKKSGEPARPARGASFALAALLGVILVLMVLPLSWPGNHGRARPTRTMPLQPVARFTRSVNVEWAPGAHRWSVGDILTGADVVDMIDGRVELTFESGAIMILAGPTTVEVQTPLIASLSKGTATVRVDHPEALEFRVVTPFAEVVDLGTEFGVRVGPETEETEVAVFEGAVDLKTIGHDQHNRQKARTLTVGEAVRVNKSGDLDRLVSVETDAFPVGNQIFNVLRNRPPLIVGVSDDFRTPEAAKFYRISRQGLREDVRAFVDRPHEWNGVTAVGIPAFLRGADYIATFNADKFESPSITVVLAEPANLYVFYDDRLHSPEWLKRDFEKTPFKIGLDEAPGWGPRITGLGVGPGKNIDSLFSIWRKRVHQAGPVTLGPMGPQKIENRGCAMYGIAATPLSVEGEN